LAELTKAPPMSAAENSLAVEPMAQRMRIFLCGDVMTGRGIDQILPQPCNPVLYEGYATSALDYVRLAEEANGPIPRAGDPSYVWGVALDELNRMRPDVRIINLETSITRSEDYAPKGINYRMSPENAICLTAAAPDCCVLANNHVMDWGRSGLLDTLATLERLRIKTAGAGRTLAEAGAPAEVAVPGKGRVLVFSFASPTSGTPRSWAATPSSAGVNLVSDLSEATATRICEQIAGLQKERDVVVVALHWGPNWSYDIAEEQRDFAHALVDGSDVSIVYGHSSHHAKAVEIYRNRLILYGCGDLLNDYEGISGYEEFRDDLALMYFADIEPATRDLVALDIVPLQIRNFRLIHASSADRDWVCQTLDRESRKFDTRFALSPEGRISLSLRSRADAQCLTGSQCNSN
jgi:poly-gamma-glutamate capsule biosynthesis protein CapA/YwtB (metallophosphatase superfamily)